MASFIYNSFIVQGGDINVGGAVLVTDEFISIGGTTPSCQN
jgi:hypothetical protein